MNIKLKPTKQFLKWMTLGVLAMPLVSCRHKSPEERAEFVVKKITKKLDLNDAQIAKLEELKAYVLDQRAKQRALIPERYEFTKEQIMSKNIDQKAVSDRIQDRLEDMQTETPNFVAKLAAFHASLNDEQKDELVKLLDKFKDRFE